MIRHFRVVLRISLLLTGLAVMSSAAEPLRNRREFVAALNKIEEEMPEAEVLKLLGKPDDIQTHEDHGGISWGGTREIWRYGTSGHLTPATLGEVMISEKHKVSHIIGQGETLPEGKFEESQLRVLLDALGRVQSFGGYKPHPVIRAVNLLQPLGKEKALDAIEEFAYRFEKKNEIEVGDAVNFVMRVLFDVPADPGYFPEMGYWFFRVAPALNKRFPRYPIILIEDIPIRVSLPVGHSGSPPDPAELVPYFRKHGVVRAKPLTPTNKPFAALDEYAKSSRWYQDPDEKRDEIVLQVLQRQIFSLLETVYQVEEGDGDPPQFDDLKDPDVRLTEASKLQIRWDAKANQYTFLDGKSLPDPDPNRYRRKIWKIPESGEDAALIFERKGRHSLSIMTENSGVEIRIFNIKAKDKTLCDPTLFTSGGAFWTGIRFDDGEELQAEVTVGDKKYLSPVFKP